MASLHVSSNATSISWVQKLQKQCNICFLVGRILSGLNEALICLIPKGDAPYSLNQFRTISLCNVLLKVVSKIPANRLKLLMSKLTNHFNLVLYWEGPPQTILCWLRRFCTLLGGGRVKEGALF